jgi:hypothetical protein
MSLTVSNSITTYYQQKPLFGANQPAFHFAKSFITARFRLRHNL